jgi:hypothetical protein
VSVVDPRELGDRELLAYLLFGDLPRAGWSRRGAFARRVLQVAGLTVAVIVGIAVASTGIVLLWAGSLPR